MKAGRVLSYVKDNGIRGAFILSADRLMGRKDAGVSYEEFRKRSALSPMDYKRLAEKKFSYNPVFGIAASVPKGCRSEFLASLKAQIYRRFRPLESCPEAEYILAVNGCVVLSEQLLYRCASFLSSPEGRKADLIYFDSDVIMNDGSFSDPAFRPGYDPDLLSCVNYMGDVVLVRRAAADRAFSSGSLKLPFHDFLKKVCPGAGPDNRLEDNRIAHIPEVLYHTYGSGILQDASTGPLPCTKTPEEAHFQKDCDNERYDGQDEPLVSVLIPNKDHAPDLKRCIDSLREVSTWQNLEILVLENNSVSDEIYDLYRRLQDEDKRIRVLTWDGPFNYSAINNFGASMARGEYLLLLNNDTRVIEPCSIRNMYRLASSPGVGAAGALLLYPDGRVQHAGIILGHGGIAGHAWEGRLAEDIMGSYQWLVFSNTHNVCAVTGACMMVKKTVWEQAGGMDESLEVTFNDVDLCMRMRKNGLRVLMCPSAGLIHYESASRGSEDTPEKVSRFHREIGIFVHRWEKELEEGDPFYSPSLTLTGKSYTCRDSLRERRKPYRKYLHIDEET